MDSDRELFERAVEAPPDGRAAVLEALCPDPAARARVQALLDAHDRAGDGFLDRPAVVLAAAAIGRSGRRLGAYQIERELGRGGMGAVYLAQRADDTYAKLVAIKIVAAPLGDEALVRRFRRERQILAQLEHPQIARLIDGGTTDDGLPYLVMEFVEGVRIDEYCRRQGLALADRLRLFRRVCDAVQYAHTHLVVHRDLKPQNILVAADGEPKLLDFGIAALLSDDGDGAAVMTQTGQTAMTPDYASPEQVRGDRVTAASDVYSLGVVLYELLTGSRPHALAGMRPDEIYRVLNDTDASRPSLAASRAGDEPLSRRLRGDLDAIVLAALRKDPLRRYASVAQFADDIQRYLNGHPVTARGEAASYRAMTFVRRHKAGVAAAAALILTLVGGIVATTRQARLADAQRREAESQRARAERRFADVRRLANSFLFEFHDAIATLPGSTPARSLVVSKALEYLDSLSAEAGGDVALQKELAAAYDKVGDVQGNPSTANLGDATGALDSYRKAEAVRRRAAAEHPGNLEAGLALATSAMKIGDALVGRGAVKEAIGLYQEALAAREAALTDGVPSPAAAHRAVVETTGRLCTTQLATGDTAGALANCQRNRVVADAGLAANPDDAVMRGQRAATSIALGNALRLTGKPQEAAEALRDAIARHTDLLAAAPANAELRRRLAVTYGYQANVQLDLKQPESAARSFQLAVDSLSELQKADPSNARTAPELSYMLNQRARVLMALDRRTEARQNAARALALARAAADRAGAGGDALNEYAWALVSTEPAELRNPAQALLYARRALERAGAPNPIYLHTLGSAQQQLGQRAAAVTTLETALGLLPATAGGPAQGIRRQIEADLARLTAPSQTTPH